jgi:hypothetical protein
MRCGPSITAYVEETSIHGQVQSRVVARIQKVPCHIDRGRNSTVSMLVEKMDMYCGLEAT